MYREDYYPFYMNFQNPGFWDEERMLERENRLMRSFYPRTARKIQQKVEEECNRMDYPGSFIYDEYPDKFMVEQVCKKVKMRLDDDMEIEQQGGDQRGNDRDFRDESLLDELIHVLFFQEMRRRRLRNDRRRRFF